MTILCLSCIGKETFEREPLYLTEFVRNFIAECKFERFHGKEVFNIKYKNDLSFQQLNTLILTGFIHITDELCFKVPVVV